MNREVFRQTLIEHCKNCSLKFSKDEHLVYISLNNCYPIFNFPFSCDFFEYKDDKSFFPEKPLTKCFEWSEASLLLCMDIADYWALRNKRKMLNMKLCKIQEDFQ